MKQKMIGVRLEGPPAVQGYQLGSQLAEALAKNGPLTGMGEHERDAFYAGMMGAILIQMLTDVGHAPAARAMANLADLLAGCVSEAQQTGVTLQ